MTRKAGLNMRRWRKSWETQRNAVKFWVQGYTMIHSTKAYFWKSWRCKRSSGQSQKLGIHWQFWEECRSRNIGNCFLKELCWKGEWGILSLREKSWIICASTAFPMDRCSMTIQDSKKESATWRRPSKSVTLDSPKWRTTLLYGLNTSDFSKNFKTAQKI